MRTSIYFILFLGLLTGCSGENSGTGNAGSQSYPSENISIIIPYGPGGGFDTTVRVFTPHFASHLGDGVNILPTNMPGTGGRRGTAAVYRADPDGYTVGIMNLPGLVLPTILGEEVAYQLKEMSWIGRIESQNYVLLVQAGSDIQNLEDFKALDKITFVSIGYGTTVLAAIQIVSEQMGLKSKNPTFLTGYTGTSDQLVALVRGDGNATITPISTAYQYVQSGNLRPIAVTGDTRSDYFPETPTFAEQGYPGLTPLNVQRSLAGPPGLPPEILAKLREAFLQTVNDPAFLAAATQAQMDVAPMDGDQAAAEIEANFSYYEGFKANLSNPNR